MMGFIRTDLQTLQSYKPHPGGEHQQPLDQLDTNESPLDLPPDLQEKLAWLYQTTMANNRYPDGSHQPLKQAIADYVNETMATVSHQITPGQISLGNGSDELIRSLLIATCLGDNGAILVANPTFSMYEIIARTLGIAIVKVNRNLTDFSWNLSEAEAAITEKKSPPIRVVFLVHPNSPTGNLLTATELDWVRSLPENILVVIDEAYFEYSQSSLVEELSSHPNWMILRTFSKAFRLAAHRVGYAIAHPDLITYLEKVRLPYNLPTFSQIAALTVLTHRQQLLASIPEVIRERERLIQTFTCYNSLQVWPSDANFIYLRACDQNLADFTLSLKNLGTLIRHTGGGLRITVGTKEENERTIANFATLLSGALS